jgi:hypothetical protein
MGETDTREKEKTLSFWLYTVGALMLILGFGLMVDGINRISLHIIGLAFLGFAMAASPKVMLRKVFEKIAPGYGKASKILFLIGFLFFALSLFVHFYYKR